MLTKVIFPNLKKGDKPRCLLVISLGQDLQSGEKLKVTIEGINKQFSECTVVIADSLQKHNQRILGLDENAATEAALASGKKWLEENKITLDALQIPHAIHHWTEYTSSADFQNALRSVKDRYNTDVDYKADLDDAIASFYANFSSAHKDKKRLPRREAEEFIREYIEEEYAVMKVWEKTLGDVRLTYPISHSKIAALVYDAFKAHLAVKKSSLIFQDMQFTGEKKNGAAKNGAANGKSIPSAKKESSDEHSSRSRSNSSSSGEDNDEEKALRKIAKTTFEIMNGLPKEQQLDDTFTIAAKSAAAAINAIKTTNAVSISRLGILKVSTTPRTSPPLSPHSSPTEEIPPRVSPPKRSSAPSDDRIEEGAQETTSNERPKSLTIAELEDFAKHHNNGFTKK